MEQRDFYSVGGQLHCWLWFKMNEDYVLNPFYTIGLDWLLLNRFIWVSFHFFF